MKKTILYAIVVIAIVAIVLVGFAYFSPVGKMICGPCGCRGDECSLTSYYWNCTDTKTYTCPSGTTNYSCSQSGFLVCNLCSTNNIIKNYTVTLTAIGNQNVYTNYNVKLLAVGYQNTSNGTSLSDIFNIQDYPGIPNQTAFNINIALMQGQSYTLPDNTVFSVKNLYPISSTFSLTSTYETKSSSVVLLNTTMVGLWTSTPTSGVFTVNNETFFLIANQKHTLSDSIVFTLQFLTANSTEFSLDSPYPPYADSTQWMYGPFPKSTTVSLVISQTQNCTPSSSTCPYGYIASCSGSIQTCSKITTICSATNPGSCIKTNNKC